MNLYIADMYICTNIHITYMHTYMHVYVCMHIGIHVWMQMCMSIGVCMSKNTHIRHAYIHMYITTYVWMHICRNICIYCCITFFYWLTAISVTALLNAIVEAMSDIREVLWVSHHLISSDLKIIASALLYCIRPSRYFHSSWICWHMLLNKGTYS